MTLLCKGRKWENFAGRDYDLTTIWIISFRGAAWNGFGLLNTNCLALKLQTVSFIEVPPHVNVCLQTLYPATLPTDNLCGWTTQLHTSRTTVTTDVLHRDEATNPRQPSQRCPGDRLYLETFNYFDLINSIFKAFMSVQKLLFFWFSFVTRHFCTVSH